MEDQTWAKLDPFTMNVPFQEGLHKLKKGQDLI